MRLSNKFSLTRIILAPVIFIIYNLPKWLKWEPTSLPSVIAICAAIPILAFAELTDYFDGHYARKNNEVSDFGKIIYEFIEQY